MFNIQKLYTFLTERPCVCRTTLITNRIFPPTGFYNRNAVHLLRGTNLIFTYNSRSIQSKGGEVSFPCYSSCSTVRGLQIC